MGWLGKIRIFVISTAALLLIVMAVSFSVMRALLPHATGYLDDIQQELTTQLGLPVTIESLDADMDWLTPRLKIINLIVYNKNGEDELIHLAEVNFSLAYIDSLRNLSPVIGSIDLVGAEIFIERHINNRWVIQGQDFSGDAAGKTTETEQLIQTLKNINYSLLDSHIHWRDFTHKTENMEFKNVDIKIESFLGNQTIAIKVKLPKQYGETLQLIAELDGDIFYPDQLKGRLFLKGSSLNIENIMNKIDTGNDISVSGLMDASLWVYFSDKKIKKIVAELSAFDVEVSNLKHSNIIWDAQQINLSILYRKLSNGWRLDVEDLMLVKNNEEWLHQSKLLLRRTNDRDTVFSANYLRLQDVMPLSFIFSDIHNNEMLKPLNLRELSGDIYNINARIKDGSDNRSVSAIVENLSFYLKDKKIRGQGIDGEITLDNNNVKISLDSKQMSLDFPDTFRSPIKLDTVTGDVEIISSSGKSLIRSPYIAVANSDLSLVARFELSTVNDVSHMDMQVNFFNVNTNKLYNYYPINALSSRVLDWTDDAINEGVVHNGSFVFRGNPAHFPFNDSDGLMEVDFAVEGLNLHYLDGWPNIYDLDANIRFYNESLVIENGIGQTQGSKVYAITATIPDLNDAILTLDGKAKSDASNLQEFVWNSGLDDLLGNALKQFTIKGNSELDFYLKTPLDGSNQVEVNGTLHFVNAQLIYPALNYVLSDVNGDLLFDETNMSAKNIKATFGKSDITINIVPFNLPDKHESVVKITGDISANALLNSFEWMPDSWVKGHSKWVADIHIPYADEEYLVRVLARSQLEKVAVNVSDGIHKPAGTLLPVEVEVFVLDDELVVNVESKDKFTISAIRDDMSIWETKIKSDIVTGVVKFKQGVSTDSTIYLKLESMVLDALTSRKGSDNLSVILPGSIPSLDVEIKALQWDKWMFSNVSLHTAWHPQGMTIKDYKLEGVSSSINGQGSWLYSKRHTHKSNFKINVFSKNLGSELDAAGIITGLKSGELSSTSDWQWQGEPYAFSWDKLKGQSSVKLLDGVMRNISPGRKGRILGLFNVLELPKRVSLDFKDVYKKGFAFGEVTANFKFENGSAYSKKINVKAPAANIRIFGRIGMQDQDYDLEVLVKPHTKTASFTGGTIVGGPILGAGLVLLQNLFKLDELAYDKYTITGSWDKPITKSIPKEK